MGARMTHAEFVEEFLWSWDRHRGDTTAAAAIFSTTPVALVQRLYRAKRAGHSVRFTNHLRRDGFRERSGNRRKDTSGCEV